MENKLKALFDFQRFQGNARLSKMIDNVKESTSSELDEDTLSLVSAAGDIYANNSNTEYLNGDGEKLEF